MASLSFQLRNIYTEIQLLKEIGEGSAKPYPFKRHGELKYTFIARLGTNQKEEVRVDFQDLSDSPIKDQLLQNVFPSVKTLFNVGFKVNENEFQYKKGEMGPYLRIMSTVSLIIQDFIKNNNPDLLYLTGSPREIGAEDDKKTLLYKLFLNKQISKIVDYNYEERLDGYVIYKNGLKETKFKK